MSLIVILVEPLFWVLPQDPSLGLRHSASFSSQSCELCHPNFACKVSVVCWEAGVCLPLLLCVSQMAARAWWNMFTIVNCCLGNLLCWKHSWPLLFIVSPGASSSTGASWTSTQLIVHFLPKTTGRHLLTQWKWRMSWNIRENQSINQSINNKTVKWLLQLLCLSWTRVSKRRWWNYLYWECAENKLWR